MSPRPKYVSACIGVALTCQAADFANLDLNSPDFSHAQYKPWPPGTMVPPQDALWGWSMQWDWTGTALPLPDLVGIRQGYAPFGLEQNGGDYFGAYSLSVHDYWQPPRAGSLRPTFHLYQVGTVPEGAEQLLYFASTASTPGGGGQHVPIQLYINGIRQPVPGLETGNYKALDVSGWGGQTVKLEFVFPGEKQYLYYGFDIKGFTLVSEPCTFALFAMAGASWWLARLRK